MKPCPYPLTAVLLALVGVSCESVNLSQPAKPPPPPATAQSTASPRFDPATLDKLALVVQDATGRHQRDSAPLRQIEDAFAQELFRKGYALASRSDIEAVMKELHFQQSGLTDAGAAQVGRFLNVPAVLVVSITDNRTESKPAQFLGLPLQVTQGGQPLRNYRAHAAISARLIAVESADWLWLGNHSGSVDVSDEQHANEALVPVAAAVAQTFPARKPGPSASEGTGTAPPAGPAQKPTP